MAGYNSDPNAFFANTFRKISIPIKDANGEWQELKIYQALNPGGTDKFFEDNDADGNLALVGADFQNIIGNFLLFSDLYRKTVITNSREYMFAVLTFYICNVIM